jgi:hypothetical protein
LTWSNSWWPARPVPIGRSEHLALLALAMPSDRMQVCVTSSEPG